MAQKVHELARFWDGLIALHVIDGDDVIDIVNEFGLHPETVKNVAKDTTAIECQVWRMTEIRRAKGQDRKHGN